MEPINRRKFSRSLGASSVAAALFAGLSPHDAEARDAVEHDYKIYRQGENYLVKSQIDDQVVHKSTDAGAAIQQAIDLSEGGGDVYLHRGSYLLDAPLRLAKNVTLRGAGRGVVLEITPRNAEGIAITGRGLKGAMVSGFSIDGQSLANSVAGVVLDDCGDCTVSRLHVKNFRQYGIWLRNNSFLCEIEGCKLAGNERAGVFLDSLAKGGRIGDYIPNLVRGCITYGGGTGIECERSIVVNLVGCVVYKPRKYGFHIHSVSNSVLVSGCRTFQGLSDAVRVEDSHELNVSSNVFCWHRGQGLHLKNVSWGVVSGNEIIDSGSEMQGGEAAIGIDMIEGVRGVQITANAIFNWGGQGILTHGVREDDSCYNNAISNNNFNFIEQEAIVAKGKDTFVANNTIQTTPSYLGHPSNPDPIFELKRLEMFIDE